MLFALEEIDAPIILDWRWKYVEALERLGADHRCRVIISDDIDLNISLKLTSGDKGKFNLEIKVESKFQSLSPVIQRCPLIGNHSKLRMD